MNQQWIVAAIVLVAAAFALWYWLPAGLRKRLGRVHPALGGRTGCGACKDCGGCNEQPGPRPGDRAPVYWAPPSATRRHID